MCDNLSHLGDLPYTENKPSFICHFKRDSQISNPKYIVKYSTEEENYNGIFHLIEIKNNTRNTSTISSYSNNIINLSHHHHLKSSTKLLTILSLTFLLLTSSLLLISYQNKVDFTKAWIPLNQIAISYNNPSNILGNNNKIDTIFLDVTLQNISDTYGLVSSSVLNIGGINSAGSILAGGKIYGSNGLEIRDGNITLNNIYVSEINKHVGIGIEYTTAMLEVMNLTNHSAVRITTNNSFYAVIQLYKYNGSNYDGWSIGVDENKYFFINYDFKESKGLFNALKIDKYGNIGIGVISNPRAKLDLNGTLYLGGGGGAGGFPSIIGAEKTDNIVLFPTHDPTTGDTELRIYIEDDPTDSLTIYGSSCKGGGCNNLVYSILAHKLEASGNVYHAANITYQRLKPLCDPSLYGANYSAVWERNNNCYLRFDPPNGSTFYEARKKCEEIDAYLVTIASQDEMDFLNSSLLYFTAPPEHNYWIGYSDARIEGQWEWITGEVAVIDQNTTYEYWASGQPDDGAGNEDCAHIWYKQHFAFPQWNDLNCGWRDGSPVGRTYINGFICEKEF